MALTERTIVKGDAMTATADEVWDDVIDMVHEATPELDYLHKNKLTKESGGNYIEIPILRAKNGTVKAYTPGQDLDTNQDDILTVAYQDRRFIGGTMQMGVEETQINSGPNKLIDIAETRITNLTMTMMETLAGYMWEFSAGAGGIAPDPLPLAINYNPAAATSWENIDPSAETYWRNKYKDSAASYWSTLFQEIHELVMEIQRAPGAGNSFCGITDEKLFASIAAGMSTLARIPMGTGTVKYAFEHLEFPGGLKLFPCFRVPDSYSQTSGSSMTYSSLYIFSDEALRLEYVNGMRMMKLPPRPNGAKTSNLTPVLMGLNLVGLARRLTGVLQKISRSITAYTA